MPTLSERVDKLEVDMYKGDGPDNPSITVRMDRVERMAESFSRNTNKILVAMALTFISVAGKLIQDYLSHH